MHQNLIFGTTGFLPNLLLWDVDVEIPALCGTPKFFPRKFKKFHNFSDIKWFGLKPIGADFIPQNVKILKNKGLSLVGVKGFSFAAISHKTKVIQKL